MIKFCHTADVHFGVENYGKLNQETGIHSRFFDFIQSFEYCVDHAIKEEVDFFLFCGDAYKTAYPTPTQQKELMRLFFKLQQAAIPIVIVVGNHDHPLSFGKAHALDVFNTIPLTGLHVFSKPEVLNLETKNGPIQIVGIPWPVRHNLISKQEHRFKDPGEIATYISEKIGMVINQFAEQLDPTIPAVLAAHLTVSNGIFSGSEKCAVFGKDPLFLPSQLAVKPFDYVALGHLHRHQNLNPKGYPPVVYSGSPERIDFGERKEEKGFCLVEIDTKKEKRSSYQFCKTPTRPMIQIEVKIEDSFKQTDELLAAIEKHDLQDAIVKLVYHLPEGAEDRVDLYAVQRACSKALSIASINPIRKPSTHERRIGGDDLCFDPLSGSIDFKSALDKYFKVKSDFGEGITLSSLKKKAIALYANLETEPQREAENKTAEVVPLEKVKKKVKTVTGK